MDVLSSIGPNRFVDESVVIEIVRYLESPQQSRIVIFACDARVLYLYSIGDKYVQNSYGGATYILPDGRPVYWLMRLKFSSGLSQLTGPEFMSKVLADQTLKGKRHMFYGSSPVALNGLKKRCLKEGVNLVHLYSPPFLHIDNLDVEDVKERLRLFQPDFFWCGLGAPKQEFLIHQLNDNEKVIMVGVGLAFEYFAGEVAAPPKIISRLGLEWMFRYAQQPRRVGRFIKPFFFIINLLIFAVLNRALQLKKQ